MSQTSKPQSEPNSESKASLIDAESSGGLKAIKGFDFQRRYALILLLKLILDPDWTAILVEAAEDVEVRFDRQSKIERRAIQLKNHRVTTGKAREIIADFKKLDEDSPGTWSDFIISCTELDDTLKTIHNGLERFRLASTFYTSNDKIQANTRAELISQIEAAQLPAEFVLEHLVFETNLQPYKEELWVRGVALDLIYKSYPGINHTTAEGIYLLLANLVSESTGTPIGRQEVNKIVNAMLAQYATPEDFVPIKLRAPLRKVFDRLLEDRIKIFGGRQDAMARIAEFIQNPNGGYLVITAPPGFGKTALMARLINSEPEAYGYHFFTRLYGEDSLSEQFFLKNVVQQMAEWHAYQGELKEELPDLRALYQQFIGEVPSKTQVLVLDGLDEVTQWKLEPYLSGRLPERSHIILTVRDMHQDWRGQYGLPVEQLTHLSLNGLSEDDILEVLRSAGAEVPAQEEDRNLLLKKIMRVAAYPERESLGADPFYVRILAEDVVQGRLSIDRVDSWPPGLASYLDIWMQAVLALADEEGQFKEAVVDLLGTLVVALGPVSRLDLQSINPSLTKTQGLSRVFTKALNQVRRFIVGDDNDGYSLGHPRLREFMRDHKDLDVEIYRGRLMDFCIDWRKNRSRYALMYYASHLIYERKIRQLEGLFDSEWIAAQWAVLGTYANLVTDLDRTTKALITLGPLENPRIFAWPIARQTARELMLNFPTELLVVWVRQGEVKRALDLLNALGNTKGRAAEPMITVATELLGFQHSGLSTSPMLDPIDLAGNLLARAIDMLPLVHSTSQINILESIGELLNAESKFKEAPRQQLIEQVIGFCSGLSDIVLKTVCLGILASALCQSVVDRKKTQDLINKARQDLKQIDFAPDQLLAIAFLLPAVQHVFPDDAAIMVRQVLSLKKDIFENSSLSRDPLIRFLEKWRPWEGMDREVSCEVLRTIGDLCFEKPDYFFLGLCLSSVVKSLLKLGQVDYSFLIIEKAWRLSPLQGAQLVVRTSKELYSIDPQRTKNWLSVAKKFTGYGYHDNIINRESYIAELAYAYAEIDEWDITLDLLAAVGSRKRVDPIIECMRLTVDTLGKEPRTLKGRIAQLVSLSASAESQDQAKVHAVAGRILLENDPVAAPPEIALAASLCLAELPAGNLDKLRELAAVAFYTQGDHPKAAAEIQAMRQVDNQVNTLAYLIERCPAASQEALSMYAQILLNILQDGESKPLYSDALLQAVNAQTQLFHKGSLIADLLVRSISERINQTFSNRDYIPCSAAFAASVADRQPSESANRFFRLAEFVRLNADSVSSYEFSSIYQRLASVAPLLNDQISPLLETLKAVEPRFNLLADQVTVNCALCEVLAEIDCSKAFLMLREQVQAIYKLKDASPGALYITRMFADSVGKHVGPRHRQAEVARRIGNSAIRIVHKCRSDSVIILADLMEAILTIDHPDDLAQALADFCQNCGEGPQGFYQDVVGLLDHALDRASILSTALFTDVTRSAVAAICQIGDLDAAQTIVDHIQDSEMQSRIGSSVQLGRERQELGELSDFDQAYASLRHKDLAYGILHSVHITHNWEEILKTLAEGMADDQFPAERSRLLNEFIPLMAAFLYTSGGAGSIAGLIAEIETFDKHFRQAARLIS